MNGQCTYSQIWAKWMKNQVEGALGSFQLPHPGYRMAGKSWGAVTQWQGACRALIVCPQCQLQPSNRPLWGLLWGGVQLCRLLCLRQLDEWISEWVTLASFFLLHPLQIVSINNHSNMPKKQKQNMLCHTWGCQTVFSLIDIGCIRSKCAHVTCTLN